MSGEGRGGKKLSQSVSARRHLQLFNIAVSSIVFHEAADSIIMYFLFRQALRGLSLVSLPLYVPFTLRLRHYCMCAIESPYRTDSHVGEFDTCIY